MTQYFYEDLPMAAVSAASHAAAEKSDMGALHVGSHVLLELLNQGHVLLPSEIGITVGAQIALNEERERVSARYRHRYEQGWY